MHAENEVDEGSGLGLGECGSNVMEGSRLGAGEGRREDDREWGVGGVGGGIARRRRC